jgi:hypothetical protein
MDRKLKHFQREGLKEFGHTSSMKAYERMLNYKKIGNFSKEGHPRNLATPPQKKKVEWRNFPRRHSWTLATFLHRGILGSYTMDGNVEGYLVGRHLKNLHNK